MENAWSDTSNDAIDGVSLHWFPKDLNLRKILTSRVKIKRGNWTGSSDSNGTLLLRTPKPPGRGAVAQNDRISWLKCTWMRVAG